MVLDLQRVSAEMWDAAAPERLRGGADLLRDRCKTLRDLASAMELLFPVPLEPVDDVVVTPEQIPLMMALAGALESTDPFDVESIEHSVRATLESKGAKLKDIALVSRLAVTGRKAGPGLFDIVAAIGRDLVTSRLRDAAGRDHT
jgi:glutamyl-tRNA synthetase